MTTSYVPVPFPTWSCRIGTRMKSDIPLVRGAGLVKSAGQIPANDSRRTRGGVQDSTTTLVESEGSIGHSWTETPLTLNLVGYEILEKRSKFTILVKGHQSDSWLIFRRYSDFYRLRNELKRLFPSFGVTLPPKRFIRDNYEKRFLDGRRLGLQTFLQNLTLNKDIVSSEAVKNFLCGVGRLSPFDSLEDSRAVCETLEKNNHHLRMELLENQREIDTLKRILEEKENYISFLVKKFRQSCPDTTRKFHTCERT
ncbi:sorting nexin-16-like isoform X2 [Takifugu rubripes]|uniref:sorting nexin-16-like isoform X2 n=1 Tax=Takifugu rubripes TaxID=31033 RepID=UPI0011459E30|nr:sorting nexin-16-like isoform X2 [Takifugu rubripes]